MKRIKLLLFAAGLLLLGSCNKDEAVQEPAAKGFSPRITAIMGGDTKTRAGVIEDNANYATLGEQFYWSLGDAAWLTIDGDLFNFTVSSLGAQRNQATFGTTGELAGAGVYDIHGYFPESAWSSLTTASIPAEQIQTNNISTHLSKYMLMKAESLQTAVNAENTIELNFKHLASVLRVAVWNNSSTVNLKLTDINIGLSSNKPVFGVIGKLPSRNDVSFVVDIPTKISNIGLSLTGSGRDFSLKDGKQQCEGYLAVMPTATNAFAESDDLVVTLSLTDGTHNYVINETFNIGTDLSFLTAGIQQGKSYYLRLKINDADLTPVTGTSYAVGDYYPDDTNPTGVVFWVKPGTFGTHGKVVGLGGAGPLQWGPDVDLEAARVAGIRSFDDGATATKNLITMYNADAVSFNANYPLFNHIYQTVNSSNIDGDWYLPAINELKMLYAGYGGIVYENIPFWYESTMPGFNQQSIIDAHTAFNLKLTGKGGVALASSGGLSAWYWSSSEYLSDWVFNLDFANGLKSPYKKSDLYYVRWIRNF